MKQRVLIRRLLLILFSLTILIIVLMVKLSDTPSSVNPEIWPTTNGGAPLDPAIEARVDELIDSMTIEEMVGQTIQADIASVTPNEVREYGLGSVLNGGNSAPNNNVRAPAAEWLALADEFHSASTDTSEGRKGIPILWGTDAVHGHNNVIGATLFPHNIGLGATRNIELLRQIGRITAREVAVTGMDWTFAPTLAVVRDDCWGRTYEGYSEDPRIVANYATAVVQGLQGELGTPTFLGEEQVIATAKHFLGDGGTANGIDRGDNLDSEEDLRDRHGAGYPRAIEAGVQTVMASFSSWKGEQMHGHKGLLTNVLKQRMGFNGFVVGDWDGHGKVPGCSNSSCPAAYNAGLDMLMAPESWKSLFENTVAQVKSGEIPRRRLEDAVRRILRVKFRLGLFDKPSPSQRPVAGNFSLLGAPEHLAVARQAVRESMVLLKNQDNLLPLKPNQRVLVAGDGADNIGKQSGGWTLSWQGTGNSNRSFPNGMSIWDGIREAVEAGGGEAQLSVGGIYDEKPDVAIVVFGEDPYAEFKGDVDHLEFASDRGLKLLKTFKAAEIPTVGIFLTGRPMWVNPELNASDAFVVAWLPGSQGGGVADVLVRRPNGFINHDFKGALSFSWPRTAIQNVNRGDPDYDPLFPYGYGLTYVDRTDLGQLSEDAKLDELAGNNELFVFGEAVRPWVLQGASEGQSIVAVDARTQVGNALSIRSVDRNAQEDARRFTWNGTSKASVEISGPGADYSQLKDTALSIQYRVNTLPKATVKLFLKCGEGCRIDLNITDVFSSAEPGLWMQTDIALDCFTAAGADLEEVTTVFGLETEGEFSISVSDIQLVTNEGQAICLDR